MSEVTRKERTSLRRKVTKKVNDVKSNMQSLSVVELKADFDLLNEFQGNLKILDSKILGEQRGDSTVSQEELDDMEDECDDYLRKIKICLNQISVVLNAASMAATASQGQLGLDLSTGESARAPNRSRINLPKIQLPEYWADERKDKLTCKRFFETLEHLLQSYELNDVEMFNLLERQCQGRAKAMISSLHVIKQTYAQAKQILISSFAEEMPQKYSLIKELTELKFKWGNDDPFIYYAQFKKIIDSVKDINIDLDTILLYFIWNGLPSKFQDILVAITNKSYPNLSEVTLKFLEASNRYLTQVQNEPSKSRVTSLASSLNVSSSSRNETSCILCSDSSHKIAKCTKYADAKQKLDRIKELKRCFKCLNENHLSKSCKFSTSGNCMKCSRGKHWSFLCTFEKKPNHARKGESDPPQMDDKSKLESKHKFSPNSSRSKKEKPTENGTVTTNLSAISSQLDITDSLLPLLTIFPAIENCQYEVDTVLDVGSQNSFIVSNLAEQLKLEVVNSHIPLLIKGINTTQKIITKSVYFPVRIGDNVHKIYCICIPSMNIKFKAPNINTLINTLKSEGFLLAFKKFDGFTDLEEVSDVKLLIGARDWAIVKLMKGGVVGPKDRLTAYYEIPDGLILVGSINDWIKNCDLLSELHGSTNDESISSHMADGQESTVSVAQVENNYDLEMAVEPKNSDEVSALYIESDEVICDDILDLASYAELDKACDVILNVESGEDLKSETAEVEKEVTDFIFQNSYRDESGKHVMAIPWLSRYKGHMGSNERIAFNVLQSVKRKHFGKDNVLERTDEVFKTQIEAGIIEKIGDFNSFKERYPSYSFLSHFPLVKEERETTKVRIVYMANLAEKKEDGSKGLSLNQCMHPGYNKNFKIADAFTLIRFDKYLLTFDISKAYHRLGISNENSAKFLFYWFKDIKKKDFTPVVFRCTRVIFGMSVSPYLLQCALYKFLIMEEEMTSGSQDEDEKLRDLKHRIYQGSYVDNFSVGCHDEKELKYSYENVVRIFGENKFPLQQFATNSPEYQRLLEENHNEHTKSEVKILGMVWDRERDVIKASKFKMETEASTARQILSTIKGAYDLQNANLPVLNRSKIFLRTLQCDKGLRWDDKLSPNKLREWRNIAKQFNDYEPVEMSRFVGNRESSYSMILFSDASKDFIGMVIYLKENETGKISFVSAHNKILDRILRGRTMPVLEFSAIEFAVNKGLEIYETLTSCMIPLNFTEIMLFTDSTIALNWIIKAEYMENKVQTRSTYVNNRIEKMVKLCREVHEVKFAHIGTNDNSADFTTRIVSPRKLHKTCFITGPGFLKDELSMYDWVIVPNPNVDNNPQLPKFSLNKIETVKTENELEEVIKIDRFSSLKKAVKTLQYVKRFINKLTKKLQVRDPKYSHLRMFSDSYKDNELYLLKMDQRKKFPEIFEFFESKCNAKKKIPPLVNQMNVVLDTSDGLLKVKSKMGKLNKGNISRTPILLSKDSLFTKMLIMDLHRKFNHSGTYYILHQVKPKYFILKAYSAVKEVIRTCYHCKRFNSRAIKTNVNDYKEWYINPNRRFFSHCFVDYFGPYFTKYGKEKTKTYCVIFKCIWSKMVNVEVVTSADTQNFLMAFQNHIYNFGLPQKLISDAGSNLTTAFSWIRDVLNTLEVKEYLDQTGVGICDLEQYPKGSLNRGIGGIIEAGVALMKKLIQGAIRNNVLDFQYFCHMIKQCVCYANKRPLTYQALREQNPDDDYQVISPEFLKYGYETAVLDINSLRDTDVDWYKEDEDSYKKVKRLMDIKDRLREHYHSEFLYGLLDQATKNKNKYIPVKHQRLHKGDVVLIKDSFVKAPNFPLAKVLEVVENSIGETTQAVLLKANKNIIKRDISSLILLVKKEQLEPTVCEDNESFRDSSSFDPEVRPKRLAAIRSQEKIKSMIDAADV